MVAPSTGDDAGMHDTDASVAGDGGLLDTGICKSGFCVAAGCGNELVQAGEECDDGNTNSADGCKVDCTFTCESDAECDDHDVCTGTETCDLGHHTCIEGTPLACDDANSCTLNQCASASGCTYSLIDADGDGHAPSTLGDCGDDCDDTDNDVYAGATELCDAKDNDCDHSVDEFAPIWYLDCDGDGYAVPGSFSTQTCNKPDPQPGCQGWTSRIPVNGDPSTFDCLDANADVHPQADFSPTAIPGKTQLVFDWNCDGVEEKEPISQHVKDDASALCGPSLQDPFGCSGNSGYTDDRVPACGVAGKYTYCSSTGGCHRVRGDTGTHVERCR
jgi:cysteine-rich repeat protein